MKKKRKGIIIVIVFCFLILLSSSFSSKQALALTEFARGDGTADNPYQIATAEHLNNVRNNLDKHFIQTANIDLGGYSSWEPIGTDSSTSFTGSYDGRDYTINNLTINKDISGNNSNVGLFGYVYKPAHLKNIKLNGASVEGGKFLGPLIGYNQGGIICNSSSVNGQVHGYSDLGGLVGVH